MTSDQADLSTIITFLAAARNTDDEDARALFAARARAAFGEAEARMASLRLNLESVESSMGKSHG